MNVEELNNFVGDLIPGVAKQFVSAEKIDKSKVPELQYSSELLNAIPRTASISGRQILLKKGYVAMLQRNLHPKNGHVHGATYIFSSMTDNMMFLLIATGN